MGTVTRDEFGRLNADGSIDASFNRARNEWSRSLRWPCRLTERFSCGGQFGNLGGVARSNIGRVDANGTVDATFDPTVDGPVFTLALQADGQIFLGG